MRLLRFVLCMCLVGVGGVAADTEKLSGSELTDAIQQKDFLLVFAYQSTCESDKCQLLRNLIDDIAEKVLSLGVTAVRTSSSSFFEQLGLGSEHKLIFYRHSVPILVDETIKDKDEVVSWIEQNKQSNVRQLNDSNFEHETQAATGATTGDWFIQFYSPDCTELTPIWESVASRLKGRINVASVNIATCPRLQKRFSTKNCPTVLFFRNGKMYIYELSVKEYNSYITFAEGWYVNAPVKSVPKEPTPFDIVVETVVNFIKDYVERSNVQITHCPAVVLFALFFALVVAVLVYQRISVSHKKKD